MLDLVYLSGTVLILDFKNLFGTLSTCQCQRHGYAKYKQQLDDSIYTDLTDLPG